MATELLVPSPLRYSKPNSESSCLQLPERKAGRLAARYNPSFGHCASGPLNHCSRLVKFPL